MHAVGCCCCCWCWWWWSAWRAVELVLLLWLVVTLAALGAARDTRLLHACLRSGPPTRAFMMMLLMVLAGEEAAEAAALCMQGWSESVVVSGSSGGGYCGAAGVCLRLERPQQLALTSQLTTTWMGRHPHNKQHNTSFGHTSRSSLFFKMFGLRFLRPLPHSHPNHSLHNQKSLLRTPTPPSPHTHTKRSLLLHQRLAVISLVSSSLAAVSLPPRQPPFTYWNTPPSASVVVLLA